MEEAQRWQAEHASASATASSIFNSATILQSPEPANLPSRSYSLALSTQIIHTRSALLSQLVSSRAYRQIEFLSVGSFYVFKPSSDAQIPPTLSRIPSTREDVFSTTAIPARAKRSLMKFLKFVLDYDSESNAEVWRSHADEPLTTFLASQFSLDNELQAYVLALTMSLDQNVVTRDGLAVINRHLTSMGVFGPGFAAVYPKWGGLSEVAQVACRAGAVGGGIYILGTGIEKVVDQAEVDEPVEVVLSSGTTVKTTWLVLGTEDQPEAGAEQISRLVAVVTSPLASLFEVSVEAAPAPAVAVIAYPPGSVITKDGIASEQPVYVYAHSSDTGECPIGQSVLYFTTRTCPLAKALLEAALESLLTALESPQCLYQLYYQQSHGSTSIQSKGTLVHLPAPSLNLAFDDSTLESIHEAWKMVMDGKREDIDEEYMVFADREGGEQYDDDE